MIRQIPGTEEVTMTTNGVLLGENLEDLLAAGLDAVNISLDTLIPEKYQEITGADELERVRKSIFMAEKSEIRVKINTVLQKGVNDEEWKSLAELAKKNKLDVRFIELMPIGQGRACLLYTSRNFQFQIFISECKRRGINAGSIFFVGYRGMPVSGEHKE